eukprot:3933784-Rhodomonas_salina.1
MGWLIEVRCNREPEGHTSMYLAVQKKQVAVVDRLIAAKCNVDIAPFQVRTLDTQHGGIGVRCSGVVSDMDCWLGSGTAECGCARCWRGLGCASGRYCGVCAVS